MNTPQVVYLSAISRHVDDLETLVDRDCLANARPQALSNLLARLRRLEQTIAAAARQ